MCLSFVIKGRTRGSVYSVGPVFAFASRVVVNPTDVSVELLICCLVLYMRDCCAARTRLRPMTHKPDLRPMTHHPKITALRPMTHSPEIAAINQHLLSSTAFSFYICLERKDLVLKINTNMADDTVVVDDTACQW